LADERRDAPATHRAPRSFINAFGVFQTLYTEAFAADGITSSDVAWIGSLQAFFLFMVSVVSGRLTDAGWVYEVWILGGFDAVSGIPAAISAI
jgi:hypothetical protein